MNSNQDLSGRLQSIGLAVNTKYNYYKYTDIELTIYLALKQIQTDKRLLGLLLSWVSLHGEKINIERLAKISNSKPLPWLTLIARFGLHCKQSRWKTLIDDKPKKTLANGDLKGAKSRIKLKGEEPWAEGSGFLIPKGSESISDKYVLSTKQLAEINLHFKNKLIYGANWRADIITAINAGAQNAFQASKLCMCSYEPAHRVYNDLSNAGILSA